MNRFLLCIALAFPVAALAAEAPASVAASAPTLKEAVARAGKYLDLKLGTDGLLRYERINLRTNVPFADVLTPAASQRVGRFLQKLSPEAPEAALVQALASYLSPRLKPADPAYKEFIADGQDGRQHLTALGKAALMDVLTAEDGLQVDVAKPAKANPLRRVVPFSPLDTRDIHARAGRLFAAAPALANGSGFDGAAHQVAGFDWGALDREVSSRGGLKAVGETVLQGYSVDRDANTVRVLVAAGRSVKRDRFKVASEADGAAVLKEAGLDAKLFSLYGARVVRAVDNLIAIDVPLPQAAQLGKALEKQKLSSAPARLFKRMSVVAGAAAAGPVAGILGGQFSPIPPAALMGALPKESQGAGPKAAEPKPGTLNFDSRARLHVDGLWKAGMQGKGATVGIIDSGLDETHPDFAGRVTGYMDFTDEGKKDPIGHGTHVAGTLAGSGAASEGKYKGMAPGAKLVVAKVFGTKGEASEDVILAAMKWMTTRKDRPDVVNMSLGGPGEPNVDPLGSMANRMMVKNNILVVAAAGNEGPGPGTIGAPGNARYILTATGVNAGGDFPFFPSRGPVNGAKGEYSKPDISAVAGDINMPTGGLWAEIIRGAQDALAGLRSTGAQPADGACIYGPGIVSARSSDDPDTGCALAGNLKYRFMTGTSMAAPMAAAVGADVIGYVKSQGATARAVEVKAAIMETASDLGKPREMQGAGLMDGSALAKTVAERVQQGLPIGNIAYMLALRLTTSDRQLLARQDRYRETALGLLDTTTGHLVNTDKELDAAVKIIRKNAPAPVAAPQPPAVVEKPAGPFPVLHPIPVSPMRPL